MLDRRRLGRGFDAGRLSAHDPRLPACLSHPVSGALHLGGDALVLAPDAAEQLEIVDEFGKARGAEHEGERVRAVVHVELADAQLEALERDPVLAAQPVQPGGLGHDPPVEHSEARLRTGQRALEDAEARLLGAHAGLQLTNATRDGAELLRQDAGAPFRVGSLSSQLAELGVDARLVGARIAGGGAGEQEAEDEQEACDGSFEAGATTHQPDFAPGVRAPASISSSLRSASAASRRTTPITAR